MQTTTKQGFTVTQVNDTYFINGKKKNVSVKAMLDTAINNFNIDLLCNDVIFKASKNPVNRVRITLDILLDKIDSYITSEFEEVETC